MIDQIYIVHYKPNVDRKEYLLTSPIFKTYNVTWNTSYQTPDSIPSNMKYTLSPKIMCVSLAHKEILEDVLNKGYQSFIVLEDDALINEIPDIVNLFEKSVEEFKMCDADMLYIAETPSEWNLRIHNSNEKIVYQNVTQCSLCTHAYSIKIDKIKSILENLEYNLPIDHEYNRLINKLGLKVGWTSPGIKQGTLSHKYKSNLR